jgi:hypothetical protein
MGAAFSSVNNMSSIGRAISSSSLLPANMTRAWLKSVSQTLSLVGAVGRLWGVFRATLGLAGNNRVVDLQTKGEPLAGTVQILCWYWIMMLDSVVIKAGRSGGIPFQLSGLIVEELLPALEEASCVEADAAFTRICAPANGLDSMLTLSILSGAPDLTVGT